MNSEKSAGAFALKLMTEALRTLDESPLPADIGAHLDLAIVRLREHLEVAQRDPEGLACAFNNRTRRL